MQCILGLPLKSNICRTSFTSSHVLLVIFLSGLNWHSILLNGPKKRMYGLTDLINLLTQLINVTSVHYTSIYHPPQNIKTNIGRIQYTFVYGGVQHACNKLGLKYIRKRKSFQTMIAFSPPKGIR